MIIWNCILRWSKFQMLIWCCSLCSSIYSNAFKSISSWTNRMHDSNWSTPALTSGFRIRSTIGTFNSHSNDPINSNIERVRDSCNQIQSYIYNPVFNLCIVFNTFMRGVSNAIFFTERPGILQFPRIKDEAFMFVSAKVHRKKSQPVYRKINTTMIPYRPWLTEVTRCGKQNVE